jgi:DNA end-binding protein Ku
MAAPRAISSGTISFGLVSIPVKLFTAARSESVSFNMLNPKTGSRVKQQLYDPVADEVVDRKELVKGYEYAKGQYVTFSEEEIKALEAEKTNTLDIVEFVPLDTVDLVQVEKSYFLGPDKGGNKAYKLLAGAMERTGKVAVGRHWSRGKENLVLIRPYRNGLILHQVYYADEMRDFGALDLGDDVAFKPGEEQLADQLIEQLGAAEFQPDQYRDEYRDRVLAAVEQKVAGHEISVAPEQPSVQIIDLFDALKASLGGAADAAAADAPPKKKAAGAAEKRSKPPKKASPKKSRKKAAGG